MDRLFLISQFSWILMCLTPVGAYSEVTETLCPHENDERIYSFFSIDDWTDIPIFHYSAPIPDAYEIMVWKDGRIAWRDVRYKNKRNLMFKSQIQVNDIERVLTQLVQKYNVPTPYSRARVDNFSAPLIKSFSVHGHIHSAEHFISVSWSIMDHYKEDRQEFLFTKDNIELIKKLDLFNSNYKMFVGSNYIYDHYSDRLVNKHCTMPITDNDKYLIAQQFIADAEYFIFFENLVKKLVPLDHKIVAKKVKRKIYSFVVKEEIKEGNTSFRYEFIKSKINVFEETQ